jgi:SAM-dependent methyltransferase
LEKTMQVDFGKTAADYGRHRAGFPDGFFEHLFQRSLIAPGSRVLDVGTGTGTVARGLAKRGCNVLGLDLSATLLQEAERLDGEAGVAVDYVRASAEETGQPNHNFDVVTAGQCWHWFDRPRAAIEARRVIVPGGHLVIGHFEWLPLPGNVVEATERLILSHNPDWRGAGGSGVYPAWFTDLAVAGFVDIESFSFDIDVPYSHEAWLGRIRASAGVGASLAADTVAKFGVQHSDLLIRKFPEQPLRIPHRVFVVFGRSLA